MNLPVDRSVLGVLRLYSELEGRQRDYPVLLHTNCTNRPSALARDLPAAIEAGGDGGRTSCISCAGVVVNHDDRSIRLRPDLAQSGHKSGHRTALVLGFVAGEVAQAINDDQ